MRSTRLRNASPVQTVDLTNDSDSDDHRSSLERHEAALPCAVKPPSRPSTRSRTFNVGERVFAYDQGVMYEARVVKTNGPMYRVHYEGYKKSQDRNLTQDFLLKLTPKNRRRFCTSRGVSFTEEAEEPKAEMGHAPAEFENSRTPEDQCVQEVTPEKVQSSRCDEEDYLSLTKRYLKPRVRENAELPSGVTLRRQVRSCFLDQNTNGFKELKKKVNALLKKQDHEAVYSILCQLRNFEINPRCVPETFRSGFRGVAEIVDLTQDEEFIDVDEYIFNTIMALPDPAISSGTALACPTKSCYVTCNAVRRIESCFATLVVGSSIDSPSEARRQFESYIPESLDECSQISEDIIKIPSPKKDGMAILSTCAAGILDGAATPPKSTTIARVTPESFNMNKTAFLDFETTEPIELQLQTNKVKTEQKQTSKKNRKRRAPSSLDLKSHFIAILPDKVSEHAVLRNTRHAKRAKKKSQLNLSCETVITPRRMMHPQSSRAMLKRRWNEQQTRRRHGLWTPSGHITGKWKPPSWSVGQRNDGNAKKRKFAGCRKSLLVKLTRSVSSFMLALNIIPDPQDASSAESLRDVKCPYTKPSVDVLHHAHSAIVNLLPAGDCEEWDVVKLARSYYDYWRPDKVKVILLAESHAFTTSERALNGPGFGALRDTYFGPRHFISLVYNLSYGENDSMDGGLQDKNNKGTPQFWTLFAACSRGVHFKPSVGSKKSVNATFAADLLKGGGLPVEERLKAKLQVLTDLKERGIWLLDASIFGWYISQPQEYSLSRVSNEIQRRPKARPPKELKVPSLVLSWELFTKHLIRDVASDGHLKLLVPIGKEVVNALSRERIEDAVQVDSGSEVTVSETLPAPNAWIPGGYLPFYAKLADLVNDAAPKDF